MAAFSASAYLRSTAGWGSTRGRRRVWLKLSARAAVRPGSGLPPPPGPPGRRPSPEGGPRPLGGHRGPAPEDALALLADAMSDGCPELALFEMDGAEWRRFYPRAAASPLLDPVEDAASARPPEPRSARAAKRLTPAA